MMRTTFLLIRERLALLFALCTCAVLSACGGGGGSTAATTTSTSTPTGTTAAATPTVTLSASAASATGGGTLTLTWTSANTNATACTASGAWSGQVATSGSQQVTAAAQSASYAATYTLTCGSAVNSTVVTVTPPQNSVTVTLDGGPSGGQFNVPYVSVTVCRPGTTVCQTIDHVMVDTGSYGLRLIAPLDGTLALTTLKSSSGAAVGECGQFVSGYTWGAVLQADVKLGGETAANQSIQVIGQAPGGTTSVPSTCSSTGSNLGTVAALGANGILGIGLFKEDCGSACVAGAVSATYYACSGTGSGNSTCTPTTMPLAQQVSNPVASFATDNNGVVLTLPTVNTGGATSLSGTLLFGIGTQDNNALGSATRYAASANGYFTTVYKGTTMSSSFIDSGSNGMFFNDSSIATCKTSTDFYCPASPLTLSATTMAYDGTASSTVTFTIEDIDKLDASVVAAWVGGPNGTLSGRHPTGGNAFDLGIPFFFGRKVFVGNELNTAGPYWAY